MTIQDIRDELFDIHCLLVSAADRIDGIDEESGIKRRDDICLTGKQAVGVRDASDRLAKLRKEIEFNSLTG